MNVQVIPTPCSSDSRATTQRTRIDGRDYSVRFQWNGREGFWYASLYDSQGVAIQCGFKVVKDWLLLRSVESRAPSSQFIAVAPRGGGEAGIDELGGRVKLCLVTP
jgi:hypothetical protein